MRTPETSGAAITALVGRARRAVEDADPGVRSAAAAQVVDTVGCILAGSTHPTLARLRTYLQAVSGTGHGSPLASPALELDLSGALVVDAVAAHIDEYDSVHPSSGTVPAGIVVTSALTVGRHVGASGTEVVDAIIAGYEVMIEAALRRGGSQLYRRGWWPSLVAGPLGAAMATAWLLRLDDERCAQALGLAAGSSGGLLTADVFGDGHYLSYGEAASRGLRAGFAASAGMTTSVTLLDRPTELAFGPSTGASPDQPPHLASCIYKAFPCSMPLQPVAQALTDLRTRLDPSAVAEVEITVPAALLPFVSADTEVAGPPEAAASAAYVVAAALTGEDGGLPIFRRHDPEAVRSRRVSIRGVEQPLGPTGSLTAIVTVTTRTSETIELEATFRPPPAVDRDKYARNAGVSGHAPPPIEDLLALEQIADIGVATRRWLRT